MEVTPADWLQTTIQEQPKTGDIFAFIIEPISLSVYSVYGCGDNFLTINHDKDQIWIKTLFIYIHFKFGVLYAGVTLFMKTFFYVKHV